MARLAELAGVGIGTLYQYFPDRKTVFAALVEKHSRDLLDALAETIRTGPSAKPEDVLPAMANVLVAKVFSHRALKQLVYHELADEPPAARADMTPAFVECMSAALRPYVSPEKLLSLSQMMVFAADGLLEGVIRKDCVLSQELVTRTLSILWVSMATRVAP
jgi:AcrR family transcriptional regulator